jgi:NAD(P)-dependent dehydrogenase (short-subunit alcohol dehydrogenase family)
MSNTLHALFDLTGRVAIVTGGSRGLGLQIAEALGEFGARVVIVARKAAELEAAEAALKAQGIDAASFACDLSQPSGIAPPPALILRSRESGVSKDAPACTGASWIILRDAIPHGMAPQDEG